MAEYSDEKKVDSLVGRLAVYSVVKWVERLGEHSVVYLGFHLVVDWDVKMVDRWVLQLVDHLGERMVVNWALKKDGRLAD